MKKHEVRIKGLMEETAVLLNRQLNNYLRGLEDPEDIVDNPGVFAFYFAALQSVNQEISLRTWQSSPLLFFRLKWRSKLYLKDETP